MATTPPTESLLPKNYTVTSSFLNQLQTEWNEFLLEVSHSTPVVRLNITATSVGFLHDGLKNSFVQRKNESFHSFGDNLMIPVPLSVLKRLFSPTKFKGDDASKIEIFNTLKKDPGLTRDASKKLRKLLFPNADSSDEVSDWPSPTIVQNFRHSAPSRLCRKNQRKPFSQQQQKVYSKVGGEDRKVPIIRNEKPNPRIVLFDSSIVRTPTVKKKLLSQDECRRKKNINANVEKEQQYSNIYDLIGHGCSDSASLFYDTVKHGGNQKKWKPTMVFTYFGHMELAKMYEIVKQLGCFRIENTVTSRTTHVICGTSKKTMNLCKAVVRGCWILDRDWIFMSANEKRWLLEERFEMSHLWPAIKENRLKRQEYGKSYRCDIFENAGNIFVSKLCTQPAAKDLEEVITLAGGRLTNSAQKASLRIGPISTQKYVREVWILNCILQGTMIDTEKYLRHDA